MEHCGTLLEQLEHYNASCGTLSIRAYLLVLGLTCVPKPAIDSPLLKKLVSVCNVCGDNGQL